MNKKTLLIIVLSVLLVLSGVGIYFLTKTDDETNLNVIETMWIEKNKNKVLDVSIFSEVPVMSYNGQGIIFDFLDSLEHDTGLTFNRISYKIGENIDTDYSFIQTNELEKNDILMLSDNYVLVSKNNVKYVSLDQVKGKTIGTLNNDLEKVNTYIDNNSYKTYDDVTKLFNSLFAEEVDLIAVPKTQYLYEILKDNFYINYNVTEMKSYFVLRLGSNGKLNDILKKYYNNWKSEQYVSNYSSHLINEFFSFSNIEEQYKTKFRSKEYVYGYVENKPFDLLVDKSLLGINNNIINEFSKAGKVKVKAIKFDKYSDLINAFNKSQIDFYMNMYQKEDYVLDVYNTISVFDEKYVVLTKYDDDTVINSINSLKDLKVSILKGTKIDQLLEDNSIDVKAFSTIDKLVSSKDDIILVDYNTYDYYKSGNLRKYKVAYESNLNDEYVYTIRGISDNEYFYKFMNFYLSFAVTNKIISNGVYQAVSVNYLPIILEKVGIVLGALLVLALIVYLVITFRPKNIRKRRNMLTKEEKLKYLDSLTSLKNRDYLNDSIEKWDNSEVYPQTIIIIDLNNIAYINDNYGHAEGDNTIKEAANVLIKNQISNSEIIRTNGNEFLIYMVSYTEKQVITYIRKLNKELKEISHNFGAAMGYSIINDGIKTIDDAINEATIDMKNNKEETKN